MVESMSRLVRVALLGVIASLPSGAGSPECSALESCCNSPNMNDPSSCLETATSGIDASACAAQLAVYERNGTCPVDAGVVRSADGGHG